MRVPISRVLAEALYTLGEVNGFYVYRSWRPDYSQLIEDDRIDMLNEVVWALGMALDKVLQRNFNRAPLDCNIPTKLGENTRIPNSSAKRDA